MGKISLRFGAKCAVSSADDVALRQSTLVAGADCGRVENVTNSHALDTSRRCMSASRAPVDVAVVSRLGFVPSIDIRNNLHAATAHSPILTYPQSTHTNASTLLTNNYHALTASSAYLKATIKNHTAQSASFASHQHVQAAGVLLRQVRPVKYQHAVRPMHLIVEAKRFDNTGLNICALPPPAHQLPFNLIRAPSTNSLNLLLDLECRENRKPKSPTKPVYPQASGGEIYGLFTSPVGAPRRFELLSLNIQTDTESFCYQASFEVSEADYATLNLDAYAAGEEPVLSLWVRGYRFDVIAENWQDTRRFIQNRYQITGRSIIARLSRDYAKVRDHYETEPRTAQQIAHDALDNTPYQIESWEMVDWLIPEHQIHEQTPIETIAEIAQAAGAFVYSHRFEPKLSTKALYGAENDAGVWRVKAPQVTISDHLILSISGKRQTGEQYRGVYVVGTGKHGRGAHVYRENSDGLPEATSLNHPYFTDDAPMRAAGIKALSDSGTHKIETVTLPLIDGVPLAELGQTWAFTERGKTWQGLIKAIAIDCTLDNDAPFITQTLTVDRYLGD